MDGGGWGGEASKKGDCKEHRYEEPEDQGQSGCSQLTQTPPYTHRHRLIFQEVTAACLAVDHQTLRERSHDTRSGTRARCMGTAAPSRVGFGLDQIRPSPPISVRNA